MTLEFQKRGKRSQSMVAHVTRWDSVSKRYRLERHEFDLGGLPTAWVALVADGLGLKLLSRHRTRQAAICSICRHAREQGPGAGDQGPGKQSEKGGLRRPESSPRGTKTRRSAAPEERGQR
jgi:hypothetical protein